jgi:cytochrome c553
MPARWSRALAARRGRSLIATGCALLVIAGCTKLTSEQKALAGKEQLCIACHGPQGRVLAVSAPVLEAQSKDYLVAQLTSFREHSRADADGRFYMWPIAAGLTDPTIDALAAYFAALPALVPNAAGTPPGNALYEKGVPDRGIAPCSSCHGDKGQGMAVFPRLAGQHRDYLTAQLHAFADEERSNPIMGPLAKN